MSMSRSGAAVLALTPLVPVLLYASAVLALIPGRRGEMAALFATYASLAGSLLLTLGILALAVVLAVKAARRDVAKRPLTVISHLLRARWKADYGLSVLVPPTLFALLLTSFNSFKQAVLPQAGFGLDPLFAAADRALFLGTDPWRVTHALFPSAEIGWLVSAVYHPWFLPMALGVFLCALLPQRPSLGAQYLLSYAAVWILLGSVFAYLLPSAGPVYYGHFHDAPDPFATLRGTLAAQDSALAGGLDAVKIQATLLASFGTGELAIGRGISAMPSVHNGLAILFSCAAFSLSRQLGWAASGYAALIWIGSIHLGWHYALDGIVAALMVVPIWMLSGRAVRTVVAAVQAPTLAPAPAPTISG